MSPTVADHAPSPPAMTPSQTLHSPPVTIVLTVALLIFFLLGFFSVYVCRCIMDAVFHTWYLRRTPSGPVSGVIPARSGLDPAAIKSLPSFLYSSVKDARRETYGLECAICLSEFRDESLLRLLTVCHHVFHQECVDLWLESHKTCPVCRRDLDNPHANFPAKSPGNPPPASDVRVDVNDDFDDNSNVSVIGIRFDEYRRKFNERSDNARVRVCNTDERPTGEGGGGGGGDGERFPRSHSTGHSMAKARSDDDDRDEDRYTLRLPDHVRTRILRARHWTASCETLGDFERHRFSGTATGDSSSGVLGEVSGSIGSTT